MDLEAEHHIERGSEVERDGGAQGVGVADGGDELACVARAEAVEAADHACLRFDHELASGRARAAAIGVEAAPGVLFVEVFERCAFPGAEVELAQVFEGLRGEVVGARDGTGCFNRALQRT